jgi:hypothetical protein
VEFYNELRPRQGQDKRRITADGVVMDEPLDKEKVIVCELQCDSVLKQYKQLAA